MKRRLSTVSLSTTEPAPLDSPYQPFMQDLFYRLEVKITVISSYLKSYPLVFTIFFFKKEPSLT